MLNQPPIPQPENATEPAPAADSGAGYKICLAFQNGQISVYDEPLESPDQETAEHAPGAESEPMDGEESGESGQSFERMADALRAVVALYRKHTEGRDQETAFSTGFEGVQR